MSLSTKALLLTILCTQGFGQNPPVEWAANWNAGNAAFSTGKYETAEQQYREALTIAERRNADAREMVAILKSLAVALRTNGKPAEGEQVLERTLNLVNGTFGDWSFEAASILTELALAQRAQDLHRKAIESLEAVIRIRSRGPLTAEAAYETTLLGHVAREAGAIEKATSSYETAVELWSALPSSGLQVLTAVDPLTAILRDEGHYARAEELLTWALHLREATFGPKGSELISTIDSLAYVQFGQQKFAEAESMYKRLINLWEIVGGPEHPMLALALDKTAEFYIAQKRYTDAKPLTERALALRLQLGIESLHRSGRVLVGQEKFDEATDLYSRTVRVASEMRIADEELPGVLRTYSLLLRQLHRNKEADVIVRRMKEAVDRKTEKEGKRPLPPSGPKKAI